MSQMLGLYNIQANPAAIADGHSIASYLVDAAGALLTSTSIGGKQRLDVNTIAEHLDGAAYAAGVDYLMSAGAVDESGNWQPLNINAAGELLVNAAVTFTAEHNEDSPASSGDSGIFTLLVRQDTLATSTSTDGDYGAFKSNALGELYVHDTDVRAQLVSANATLTNIKSDTASIVTNTGNTATNTSNISSVITALSKAEDAVAVSGDQGIQALAVRKDAQGSNVGADGDYSSLLTWSEGSLKVVDIANASLLQQQISVSSTAAQVPAANLANRRSLMLQNTSLAKIWIGSATVTSSGATAGIELPASSFIELEVGPAVNVFAIKAGAGSLNLNVLELA